jgi:hypothetical protein
LISYWPLRRHGAITAYNTQYLATPFQWHNTISSLFSQYNTPSPRQFRQYYSAITLAGWPLPIVLAIIFIIAITFQFQLQLLPLASFRH